MAIDVLEAAGLSAPVNRRVAEMAYAIESGALEARPENAPDLVAFLMKAP